MVMIIDFIDYHTSLYYITPPTFPAKFGIFSGEEKEGSNKEAMGEYYIISCDCCLVLAFRMQK